MTEADDTVAPRVGHTERISADTICRAIRPRGVR